MSITHPAKYPPAVNPANWNAMVDRINGYTPTGVFQSPYSYLILKQTVDGTDYYFANNAFQTVFGGDNWAVLSPTVDGTDLAAVTQACINDLTAGVIHLKDLDVPAVTEKDGVIIISTYDGMRHYRMTNPVTEVSCQTNTQNAVIFNFLSQPTNGPSTLDAWSTITSEIMAPTGTTKYFVAGYFGAHAPSGSGAFIWGLNTLVWLDAGSTGNAIGIEVDVNNYQADDVGEGVTVALNNGFNAYSAFKSNSTGSARWNRAFLAQYFKNYAFIASHEVDNSETITGLFPTGVAGFGTVIRYNDVACYAQAQTAGVLGHYHYNLSAVDADLLISYYNASGVDANPRFKVTTIGNHYWGAGGANAFDTNFYRTSANLLKTDDQFIASDGVATKVKAGSISDADLTNTTVTGVLAVDTSNNRIYFRTGTATWKYCQADGGFVVPKEEKVCGVCHEPILKGEFVCGQIETEMSDGALHGLWVHLKCAK